VSKMIDIGQKIWHFCHTLRDEGMSYGNYIEQLTYLLFLKMAAEKDADIPKGCGWNDLIKESGDDLMKKYDIILEKLSKTQGVLGDIFANAKNLFRKPVGLKKIIDMINDIDWGSIPVDKLGTIYEDLLQRYAEEKKGGAGQYFTPRPLIKTMCKVMKPTKNMKIHDPACGTGGFLIAASEYILEEIGGKLDPDDEEKLKYSTFSGQELVLDTRRLCIMNLYLHGVHDGIEYGDSLAEQKEAEWDMVLTNPPFGVKSGGEVPHRPDFNVETANKQLNFVQHVMSGLKPTGKAAMVLPDNVLFEEGQGKELRKVWIRGFNVHTILRLPIGTFTYSPGVKANVVFFDKGKKTTDVWVYDMRTNITKINKGNSLKEADFDDFITLYTKRKETDRFKVYSLKTIEERDYNLDIKWIQDDSQHQEYEDPDVILENIKESEEKILDQIEKIIGVLQNGK
jgi:type I restriction enzyme M protein